MIAAASAVTALAVGWLLAAERTGSAGRALAKPLASAGFLAVALAAGALDSTFGRWMLAALVLSAVGDVFLLGTSDRTFLGGLGSFLVAHVLFAAAFVVRGIAPAGWAAAVPLGVFLVAVLRWLRPHLPGQMRLPVVGYAVAISVMGVLAVATAGERWDWRIPVGAGLFIASDVAVARQAFVMESFTNRLWGLPAYYLAQVLLAWAAGG